MKQLLKQLPLGQPRPWTSWEVLRDFSFKPKLSFFFLPFCSLFLKGQSTTSYVRARAYHSLVNESVRLSRR